MPSARIRPPKGMHPRATISANQPVLVLAPVGENPPSTVSSNMAANRPAPRIDPPHCRSWRVPSPDGRGFGLGRMACIIAPTNNALVEVRGIPPFAQPPHGRRPVRGDPGLREGWGTHISWLG